ncbi:MAG: hypothetical protein HRU70_14955 [Phycisphaeraceae bacterium]|nr:MAG: hypothetical protein HRU70_14955 [Phycisphaeraceae bacterium]
MTARPRISPGVRLAGLAAIVLLAGYGVYEWSYGAPMRQARASVVSAAASVRDLEERLADERAVQREMSEIGRRLLGLKRDAVEHRLTAGLRAVAERGGLKRVIVSHGEPIREMNPLTRGRARVDPSGLRTALRTSPDFMVIRGDVGGQGTLAQVLRVLSEIDSQPWLRVEGFLLKPIGAKDSDQFSLRVDVAIAWAPELLKEETPDPVLAEDRPGSGAVWRAIAARNPFRDTPREVARAPEVVKPVGEPAAAAPTAPAPEIPPPPPPYAEWRLTGVVRAPRTGVQALLVNTRTSASVTVLKGASVENATLVDAEGETAVFRIGEELFRVRVSQTLAERTPAG